MPKKSIANTLILIMLLGSAAPCLAQEVVPTAANLPLANDEADEVDKVVRIARNLGPKASTPAQIVQLTRGMKGSAASQVFLRVAKEFLRLGQIDVAADVVSHLLRQHPQEPTAVEAGLLLVQLYSSSEIAHCQQKTRGTNQHNATKLLTYSSHLTRQLLQQNPALSEAPQFAFQCAVIARQRGSSSETKSWLTIARHQKSLPEWRQRALAETWLTDESRGDPPLSVSHCLRSDQPPHLDGSLEDPCWKTSVSSQEESISAKVFLLYDEEYLYLAASCEKHEFLQYKLDDRPRTYDANLSGQDRLEFSFDLDRDYASCYRLTVDHRGWTNDACWLDQSWNPRWFVAAEQDASTWSFEAAIPWSELVASPPETSTAWAVGVKRLGTQEEPPTSFRILRFEQSRVIP